MPRTKRSLKGDGETKEQRKAKSDEVWRLAVAGKAPDEIAAAVEGVTPARAANIIANRLRQIGPVEALNPDIARPAGAQRALEIYEAMRTKAVADGDPAAASAALKASDQLNRLGGGYPAEKVEVGGAGGGPLVVQVIKFADADDKPA